MLIADDVGAGKTIEACLIAKELLDRGEASRLCVLCPPHLAEQWQVELRDKFPHSGGTGPGQYRRHDWRTALVPLAVRCSRSTPTWSFLSTSSSRTAGSRNFSGLAPNWSSSMKPIPVPTEASDAAAGIGATSFSPALAAKADRHLIMVTATPHSGNEAAFRSPAEVPAPEFSDLPEDLSGRDNEQHRRRLAQYFVQRRRGDIRHYLQADTPFPRA